MPAPSGTPPQDGTQADQNQSPQPQQPQQPQQSWYVAEHPPCQVSSQVTDSVAMTNVATIGVGPSYAALQSMLGQSQSQSVLMANMVSAQRQNAMVGMTTMTKGIEQIMNRRNQ